MPKGNLMREVEFLEMMALLKSFQPVNAVSVQKQFLELWETGNA